MVSVCSQWRESPTLCFPASNSLFPLLGLLIKDSSDPIRTAHAFQLWQELMASRTASCPPYPLGEGNCEPTSRCLLGTSGTWDSNGDSVDSHQGTSICFRSLWEVTLADKESGQLSIFEMLLLPALIIPCSCLYPRYQWEDQCPLSGYTKVPESDASPRSWSTGDGDPGTTCQLCPLPLFLNHICWALFCWQDWPFSIVQIGP